MPRRRNDLICLIYLSSCIHRLWDTVLSDTLSAKVEETQQALMGYGRPSKLRS